MPAQRGSFGKPRALRGSGSGFTRGQGPWRRENGARPRAALAAAPGRGALGVRQASQSPPCAGLKHRWVMPGVGHGAPNQFHQ